MERRHRSSNSAASGDFAQAAARQAFTLIELVVVFGVVGIVVALALPTLVGTRAQAVVLNCQANTRTSVRAIDAYADRSHDMYPFAGVEPREAWVPGVGYFGVVGGRSGLMAGAWATLFPEEWDGLQWSRAMRCPKQPDFDPSAESAHEPPFEPAAYAVPFYYMWHPFWIDPSDMTEVVPYERWRPRAVRVSDVTFPSAKAILNEHLAFCATEPSRDAQLYWFLDTSRLKSSVAFCDGSVARASRVEGVTSPLSHGFSQTVTHHGVRGRDR
ncbi:MAG: hypothetical protein IT439_11410 [Phycisphaerales bacterium]|nr:hypothetical protein [Phycisphaerales bacterium]